MSPPGRDRGVGGDWWRGIALVLILVLAGGCGDPGSPPPEETWSHGRSEAGYEFRRARVVDVMDGDSFRVRYERGTTDEVRVMGIDCPETSLEVDKCWSPDDLVEIPCRRQVPHGRRARRAARRRLMDRRVRLESYDSFSTDDFGRVLAYVRLPDGADYGRWMLERGLCVHSGRRYDHPRRDRYKRIPDLLDRLRGD